MAKVKKKKFVRRQLDRLKTLKAYENRIKLLPDEEFNLIRGKWLCDFQIWDRVPAEELDDEIEMRYGREDIDNHVWRLCYVAKLRNVPIRGVTSTRIKQGIRIAAMDEADLEHMYFVGNHYGFQARQYKANQTFSVLRHDKRYVCDLAKKIL